MICFFAKQRRKQLDFLRNENFDLKLQLMELSALESVHLARIAQLEKVLNDMSLDSKKDGHDRL